MAQKKEVLSAGDVSILSSGVKFEGKMYSNGNMRVDGEVIGELTINGNLTLGESARLNGEIKARNITISGKVEGVVTAAEKIIMESGSSLRGDLSAKILVIEEGALFDGKSVMTNISSNPVQNG